MSQKQAVDYNQKLTSAAPQFLKLIDKFWPNSSLDRRDLAGQLLGGGDAILDLGAGVGLMLKKHAADKYELLAALDVAEKPLQEFENWAQANNIKHQVFYGDFIDLKIEQRFDTVTALAYLEHQVSPFAHLKKISSLLKNDGEVILEVPNVAYLFFRLALLRGKFPTTAHHAGCIPGVVDAHLRFFTPPTMEKLLKYCGFKIELMTCSGRFQNLRKHHRLFWPDIVVRARKVNHCPELDPVSAESQD